MCSIPEALKSQTEMLSGFLSKLNQKEVQNAEEDDWGEEYGDFYHDDVEDEDDSSPMDILLSSINEEEDESLQALNDILDSNNEKPNNGPALNPKVAESFERAVKKEMTKEEVESLRSKYLTPENGKSLSAPRVNPQVWRAMSAKARTSDNKLQFLQSHLYRSVVAQARVADNLFKLIGQKEKNITKSEVTELLAPLLDSASSVGVVARNFSFQRRSSLKSLTPLVSNMCNSSIPITEFLFGDNFDSDLKTGNKYRKVHSLYGTIIINTIFFLNIHIYDDKNYSMNNIIM
jgi:hypothetical protein